MPRRDPLNRQSGSLADIEQTLRAATAAVSAQATSDAQVGTLPFMVCERLAKAALDAADHQGAVQALETIRDWRMPTGNAACAGVIERMQLLARQTLAGGR